jgi:serine/threonine protein phosphatase PrpC/CRP-like cAMP-binding protein
VDNNNLLLIVSDGMGAYEGGEVASRLTVRTIKTHLPQLSRRLSPQSRLEAAIEEANSIVWSRRKMDKLRSSMGATVTVALIEKNVAYIAEVGDTRAYVLRGDRIKLLTTDQTVIQVLIDSGALTPEMAEKSAHKNVLLQSVGSQELLQIAVSSLQLQVGDILLLCSDGLHGKLKDDEIKNVVRQYAFLNEAAEALIQEAKARGGEDNITAVLAKFEGDGLQSNVKMRTITESLRVISRYDPEAEPIAKPKLEIRSATFQDLINSAVIDHFAHAENQRRQLSELGEYGEYLCCRKGDWLVRQGDKPDDGHYWLLSGCFRVEVEQPNGELETVAFIVPPTDPRTDEEIQSGLEYVRVKRQFFTASIGMLNGAQRSATIWCEDVTNTVVRIPYSLYLRISEILGEKFITMVRHC